MPLLPFFQWLAQAQAFDVMRNSKWGFATVEMVHLLGLAAFGGAVLIADLSALGLGLRRDVDTRPSSELAPMFWIGFGATVISGALLVSAEALKCYYHPAFRLKMAVFALALCFRLVRGRLEWPEKLSAVISLALWLAVGLAGRAVGFI